MFFYSMARADCPSAALLRPAACFLWAEGLPLISFLALTLLLPLLHLRPVQAIHHDNNSVQPLGSGIEVVTKALGVLDVRVTPGPGNVSISPAHVVDGRRSVLSKKTDVTLSHILGGKEFFSSFPAENFTYLRKPKSWGGSGHSQLSYKANAKPKKASPQHKTEEKEVSEPVKEESATATETTPAVHAPKEDSSSTETQKTEDGVGVQSQGSSETQKTEDGVEVESQGSSDAEVPVATEATETTEASPEETKDAQQPEVVEEAQQQEEKSQVENPKEDDQPSATPTGDAEAKKESPHPQEATTESAASAEVEAVTEAPVIPLEQPTEEEKTTTATEALDGSPAAAESGNETEEAVKGEGEAEAVAAVDSEVEEATDEKTNVTEEEKVPADVPEAEEDKEDKDKPAGDSDAPEEITKKKKKPSEPEKPKKKDAAEKSPDAKQDKPPDTLETYSQFTQRVNAEKKNDIVSNGHGSNGHGKGPKVKSKNYASPDCGSKLLTANPEASHASKVIHANKDEYLLNKCRDKTWFVIELCESIRPQKFDIANFELFSNLPKDIHVLASHRYPSRDWTPLARARGQEGNRAVQSFPIETEDFFKYIKVEVHSHYGSEFFCPISLFRIYGLSEFEVIDTVEEPEEPEEPEEVFIDVPAEKKVKDEGKPSVIPTVIKNMFSGVLDVIKRGYRPRSASSEPGDNCYSLHPSYIVDKLTCQLADSLNYILSCYRAEYQVLMRRSFVSQVIKNSGFCRLLASTMCLMPEVSDGVVYDTACNSSYLCIMLSPKHVLAMCFMHDSRIMDSQVACESDGGTLLPENFSATTPAIMPPENTIPPYVKNAKINTSTITRTDPDVHSLGSSLTPDSQDMGAKQFPVDHVAVSPEEPAPSGVPDASNAEVPKPKKVKAAAGSQDRGVKEAEQPDNTTEPEEGVPVDGSAFVGLELAEEDPAKEEEEKQEEEAPVHVTPLPAEPKVSSTSPTNKESVVVRLSNKIKALEYNMSISSQYLEELSRRYKRQMEEMQRQFNLTIAALNATSRQAFERDQHHQRDIEALEMQLASVSDLLGKLVEERENLAHTVVEQHLLLMVVEVVVLCVVFVLCHKRTSRDRLMQLEGQDRRAQTPSEDPSDRQLLGGSSSSGWSRGRVRRRSVDSITRERSGLHRRCRRPSEEALRISGTYEDLLIIEPAIPIMVDSVSDRRRKKKSSSGTLKRSKSNASIVEKSCSSTRRSRRIETLDMSSAGVLFCGDQVEAKEAPSTSQTDSASPHCPGTSQELPGSAAVGSRMFVEEVTSDGHPHDGTQTSKGHSFNCCQNSEISSKKGSKLSKSHSVSCASEKLKSGAEKKKMKKLKKKNFSQESQQHFVHESEFYPAVNGTPYNGHGEHAPEYYYNGSNSVHFSEATDTLSSHMFSADVTDGNIYVNGNDSVDQGYVGSDYMHSGYTSGYSDRHRTSPVPKVKLRSDNWEWYSLQHFGSSSETVSTCSDSSNKIKKGKREDVPLIAEKSDEKKGKKKKKSKARSVTVLEEETNGGT